MKRLVVFLSFYLISVAATSQWIDNLRLYPIPTTPQQINRYNMRVYFPAPGHTFYSYQQSGIHWSAYTIGRPIHNYDSIQTVASGGGNYEGQYLDDLFFLNKDTAYASVFYMYSSIRQSFNGGQSWTNVPCNIMLWMIDAIAYPRVGLGYYLRKASSQPPQLEMIVNDNGNCTIKDLPKGYYLPSRMVFLNDSTGFVLCRDSSIRHVLIRTEDAANTWSEVVNSELDSLRSLYFKGADMGYLISRAGFLYTSEDAGKTWSRSEKLPTDRANDVFFVDKQRGYVACDNGQLLITSDGGVNWESQNTGIGRHLKRVYFEESGRGFLLCNQDYLHTNFITGLDGITEGKWRLGPNPASDLLRINMPANDEKVFIQIFNMQGQAMTAKTAQSGDVIDVSWLRNGLYVIVIEGGGKTTSRKFVKQGIQTH